MMADPETRSDFSVSDGAAIESVTATGSRVVLALDRPSQAQWVAYEGHWFDGAWITNARGNGLLMFRAPIEAGD